MGKGKKQFRVTSETTFGQARVRGITKKEFQRRQNISISLRKRKRVIKVQVEDRIRKQVVLDLRTNEQPYFASIRAVTINPIIDERGLRLAIMDAIKRVGLNPKKFKTQKYFGLEQTRLAQTEEKTLNDNKIHVEVHLGRDRMSYTI